MTQVSCTRGSTPFNVAQTTPPTPKCYIILVTLLSHVEPDVKVHPAAVVRCYKIIAQYNN
jgi:hypothetical protein